MKKRAFRGADIEAAPVWRQGFHPRTDPNGRVDTKGFMRGRRLMVNRRSVLPVFLCITARRARFDSYASLGKLRSTPAKNGLDET